MAISNSRPMCDRNDHSIKVPSNGDNCPQTVGRCFKIVVNIGVSRSETVVRNPKNVVRFYKASLRYFRNILMRDMNMTRNEN